MTRTLTAYEAKDGTIFRTLVEVEQYEERKRFQAFLHRMFPQHNPGSLNIDIVRALERSFYNHRDGWRIFFNSMAKDR